MTVNKLKILDPITFPREISLLPLKAAVMLTAASGALVPRETSVSPITMDGIFNAFAMEEEPSTKKSAPLISRTKPANNNKYSIVPPVCAFRTCFGTLNDTSVQIEKETSIAHKKYDKSLVT